MALFFKYLYVIISYMKRANDAAMLGSKIAAKMQNSDYQHFQ